MQLFHPCHKALQHTSLYSCQAPSPQLASPLRVSPLVLSPGDSSSPVLAVPSALSVPPPHADPPNASPPAPSSRPGPGLPIPTPLRPQGPGPLSHGRPYQRLSSGPRSPELTRSLLPAHTSPAGLRLALTYQPPLSKRCLPLPLPRAGSPLARSPALTHPPAAPLASFFSSP